MYCPELLYIKRQLVDKHQRPAFYFLPDIAEKNIVLSI